MDFYFGDGFAAFLRTRQPDVTHQTQTQEKILAIRPWINAKIMKVAYLIICLSVLFFVFSCLLSIPPSYIEDARNEGVTILSALSMMPNAPAWLSISGIIVAVVAMSKSFLGTYFGVIEGATEMVRTTLQQVGVKKAGRSIARCLSCWSPGLRLLFAVLTRMPSL